MNDGFGGKFTKQVIAIYYYLHDMIFSEFSVGMQTNRKTIQNHKEVAHREQV